MARDFDPYHRWLGIAPEEQPPDHYRLLGVSRFESDREVISNASDQRMIHLRSFAAGNRSAESQRLLNEVAAATHCLLNPAKKLQYDSQLRASVPSRPPLARPLPVAVAMAPREAVPLQSVPVQASPLARATPVSVDSAPNGFVPQVNPRRPVRRSNKSGFTTIVAGLLLLALIGGGGIYAWRAWQQVAERPAKLRNDNAARPIVAPTRVSPGESDSGKTRQGRINKSSSADNNRRAWFYTNSPEGARGLVYLDAGNRWVEKTSDGRHNEFVEREVTADAIKLEDASRKLVIWLKRNEMTFARDGAKQRFCMKGEWVPVADTSALLASLSRPALPESRPPPEKGKPVAVRRFSGENQARLACPPGVVAVDKPLTVEFWYRRDSDFKNSCGLIRLGDLNVVLVHKDEGGGAEHFCQVFSAASGTAWSAAAGWQADKQWHHLALCSDDGKLSIFHDGKPVTQLALAELRVEALEPVVFGAALSDQGSESFRGDIKSIRIADTALYQPNGTFNPPSAQADQLLANASLTFAGGKEAQPESKPRSLTDLVPGVSPTAVKTERSAPPEGEKLKAAEAAVQSVYGARAKMAQKPDDKQKLAAELLKTAVSDADAARSYALLAESRRLAADAMDVGLSIEILNELDRRFDVDRLAVLEKILAGLEKRSLPLPQREVHVDEVFAGVAAALDQDKVEVADSLSVLATRSASKGRDPDKKKFALAWRERVVARKSAWQAMQAAEKKLADAPDDPAAHLAVGRYLAFALDDYAKGCEHLAKGSDAAIAAAAQLQLAAESDDDQLAAIEAWNGVLPNVKSPAEKLHLQSHVLTVCQELAPRLTGLASAQAQKHIEQLTPVIAEANKYIATSGSSSEKAPGLIARIVVSRDGKPAPTPFVGTARSESEVFQLNNLPLLQPYLSGQMRYVLGGAIVLEKDMQVQLRFADCTVTLLNERRTASRPMPINQVVMLKRGTYPILIESRDSSFSFDVTDTDTRASLLFHRPRDLETELQRPGFDATGAPVKSQRLN